MTKVIIEDKVKPVDKKPCVGQWYKHTEYNDVYVLACISSTEYGLINVKNGIRWINGVEDITMVFGSDRFQLVDTVSIEIF